MVIIFFKKYKEPILIFIIFNILGILISLIFVDKNINYSFPVINFHDINIWGDFSFIFINNITVLLMAYFVLRIFLEIKNKYQKLHVYSMYDKYLYILLNSIILIKTGLSTGMLLAEVSIQTNTNILNLYLFGIFPHGIIEMIPFMIAYYNNSLIIKKESWYSLSHINIKQYLLLCLVLLVAALIESIITPMLLYSNLF